MYDGRAVRHTWLLVFSPLGVSASAQLSPKLRLSRRRRLKNLPPKRVTSSVIHATRVMPFFYVPAPKPQPVFERRALKRRASFRTRKGRSNSFNPRIVLSENRLRFSESTMR
ncbi:hypothetical protein ELH26_17200 [Rhizobium leguminosarum]|nr:hypothetical protein ELI43_16970 [Rhizobium leguminosarum]TBC95655.1 hypothetical protein ELH26_17200 [Rhizobium leguminosarum]TBD06117.1 hypothetical protein ELH21_17680 [Rhizobium leguminosarum]